MTTHEHLWRWSCPRFYVSSNVNLVNAYVKVAFSSLATACSVGEESLFLFTRCALLRSQVRENYPLAPFPMAVQEGNTFAWAYIVKSDTWEKGNKV